MTSGDPIILDPQDLVDTQQLIMVHKHKTKGKINLAKRLRKVTTLCEKKNRVVRSVGKK